MVWLLTTDSSCCSFWLNIKHTIKRNGHSLHAMHTSSLIPQFEFVFKSTNSKILFFSAEGNKSNGIFAICFDIVINVLVKTKDIRHRSTNKYTNCREMRNVNGSYTIRNWLRITTIMYYFIIHDSKHNFLLLVYSLQTSGTNGTSS